MSGRSIRQTHVFPVYIATPNLLHYEQVKKALQAPLKCLADNAGDDGGYVAAALMEHMGAPFWGYDAASHRFRDLAEAGILDPAQTLCSAFRAAMETAGIILTVSGAVTA